MAARIEEQIIRDNEAKKRRVALEKRRTLARNNKTMATERVSMSAKRSGLVEARAKKPAQKIIKTHVGRKRV